MATDALAQQQRLVSLLDGLQALARGDAAPAFAPVDLAEVVDASLVGVGARHPGVTWRPDLPAEPVPVDGWDAGLRSLVENLLENAARHGARDGHGTVRVRLDPSALVVEDDGPGVPEADSTRIFEPFARAGDGDRPGSGLGLALVAQQARLHGMTVAVDGSPALGGARFTVRL
jgi:signal transduction histidine kinase